MTTINTNISSLNAQRNLTKSSNDLQTSMTRLSSGLRVNSAKDDAAGMSIATKMDSQVRGMSQASRNANDGISMIQTADGAMSNISDALQRMRELAVQAANGTNGTDETGNIGTEMDALAKEVGRIATLPTSTARLSSTILKIRRLQSRLARTRTNRSTSRLRKAILIPSSRLPPI